MIKRNRIEQGNYINGGIDGTVEIYYPSGKYIEG